MAGLPKKQCQSGFYLFNGKACFPQREQAFFVIKPEKGKPSERMGRKAADLSLMFKDTVAGLPG